MTTRVKVGTKAKRGDIVAVSRSAYDLNPAGWHFARVVKTDREGRVTHHVGEHLFDPAKTKATSANSLKFHTIQVVTLPEGWYDFSDAVLSDQCRYSLDELRGIARAAYCREQTSVVSGAAIDEFTTAREHYRQARKAWRQVSAMYHAGEVSEETYVAARSERDSAARLYLEVIATTAHTGEQA